MPEMRSLSIEQVHGGTLITTQMTVVRDDGSTAYQRSDRYVTANGPEIITIVSGFLGLGRFELYQETPDEQESSS